MSSLLPLLYVGARNNATTPEMDESLSSSVIQAICMLSPRVPEDTRQQAQASLDEFKSNNPDAWRVCLSIFLKSVGNTGYFQRFFVALNIQEEDSFVLINVLSLLESFVRFRYQTLLEEDQLSLKTVLYTWIAQQYAFVEDKFPAFLRNKIAWILVLIFRSDFPNPWRSFFADFFILSPISASCMSIGGMAPSVMAPALPVLEGIAPIVVIEGTPPIASTLGSSPAAQLAHVDLLTRILLAIDQEVVDRDVQRADSELAQNALIKDAMREDCIPAIVELFYRIFVEEFFQQHTSIIASCLQVMSSYIPWIEISLVVSPRFLEVFFRFLLVPQLRDNACLCLNRVIVKGMDAPAKIALIESISIISVVHSVSSQIAEAISSGATSEEQEEDFMASLASLVNTIGIQLMTNISKLQSGVVVTAAAPLGEEDPALASQACQMGLLLLQQCLPLMFAFLGHEDDDISLAVTPFATEFIRMNLADSTKQLGDLLSIVIHKMRYDADFDFEDAEEDQAALFEIRKAMKILFDHIRALNPEMVLSYVHDFVLHNINNWSNLNFVDVEIALKLMFYVGESQASSLFQELSLDGQTSGTGRTRSSNSGSADGSGTTTPGGSSSSGGLGIPTTPLSASNSGDPSLLSTSPSASQMNSALSNGTSSTGSGGGGGGGGGGGISNSNNRNSNINNSSHSNNSNNAANLNTNKSKANAAARAKTQSAVPSAPSPTVMTPALHQQYNDTFHSMMTTVLTSNVCAYPHPVVVMEFFEVVFRYYRFFEVAPQHIPVALEAFLDTRGIRQEHIGRRGRATYLFSKFVLNLRRLMVDYVDAIIASMQDLLVLQPDPVLASSQPASPVASRRASGAVNPNTLSSALTNSNNPNNPNNPNSDNSATTAEQHAFEDQLFFFETISYLIAIDLHSAKRQQDLLRGFLDPLINQFNEVVDRELYLSDTLEVPTYATFCGQIIQVATSLTKGYSSDNYVRQLNLSDVFLQALEAFCKIFKIPHCQERLRSALRQYIHRMVTCLGDDLIRLIPTLVSSLLSGTQAKDLGDFAQLLGQFAVKYKAKIADFLNESLLTIVSRFFEALEAPIEANDQESRREKQQLKRRYYYLIGAFLGNDLGIVFTSPNNIQLLTPVLSTIIQGATDSSDQDGQKLCFPILTKCIELWAVGPESGGAGNEFNALVYQQIIPACFSAILSPSFGFDAQANILLQHISLTLRSATLKCGQEFINYFSSVYLPTLPFTYEFQQGLLQTLIQSYQITAQEFSRNFKTLIMLLDPKRQR